MYIGKKTIRTAAVSLFALTVAAFSAVPAGIGASAATTGTPYNVTAGVGTNESEVRFTWMSQGSTAGVLEIAKTGDVKNGSFPAGSDKKASTAKVSATEGVLDAPNNSDHSISDLKDANGNALQDEYSSKVTVGGLSANTSYTYRVGDGTTWSKTYTFQTEDPKNGFSFAAFGDPQIGASGNPDKDKIGWANTLSKVYARDPKLNFLFTMGDQVNDYDHLSSQQKEYDNFFNPDFTKDYLQDHLLAAFSGNHDFQMGKYYSFHYNQPNLSTLGQTTTNGVADSNGDYWFRYGNSLFMQLEGNNFYDTAAHDSFLQQAISANPTAKWKVVSFHQAPYSEANHDGATTSDDDVMFMRKNWTKLMDKYGVDIVLNGHDHYYTRSYQMYGGSPVSTAKTDKVTNPKGTVYFTLDSGSGSKYYKYNTTADHSFSAFGWQNNTPTYTYAKVTDKAFTLTTYATNSDKPIDTYTITKTTGASGTGTVKKSTMGVAKAVAPSAQNTAAVSDPLTDGASGTWFFLAAVAAALIITVICIAAQKKKANG